VFTRHEVSYMSRGGCPPPDSPPDPFAITWEISTRWASIHDSDDGRHSIYVAEVVETGPGPRGFHRNGNWPATSFVLLLVETLTIAVFGLCDEKASRARFPQGLRQKTAVIPTLTSVVGS
jgi:hypothetical protein